MLNFFLYQTHKVIEITKEQNAIPFDGPRLSKIFRIFEKQNEVDFFTNKDAEAFLKEQFDVWLKYYSFDDEADFTQKKIKTIEDFESKLPTRL